MGRIIPNERVERAVRWQFGAMDAFGRIAAGSDHPLRAAQAAQQHHEEQALLRETAFQQGFEAGRAQAAQMATELAEQFVRDSAEAGLRNLQRACETLAAELQALRGDLSQQVLELSTAIAQQVVRQAVREPDALRPVIAEALAMLLDDTAPRVVYLHPDDLALLPAWPAAPDDAQPPVLLRADAALARGDCRVVCNGRVIDATLARRWQRAVARLGLHAPWPANASDGSAGPRSDDDD